MGKIHFLAYIRGKLDIYYLQWQTGTDKNLFLTFSSYTYIYVNTCS